MPDPFERHGRPNSSDDYWDSQPSRSELLRRALNDDPVPGAKSANRKNPNLNKPGSTPPPCRHEYVPQLLRHPHQRAVVCGWGAKWDFTSHTFVPGWLCYHRSVCKHCGDRTWRGPDFCPMQHLGPEAPPQDVLDDCRERQEQWEGRKRPPRWWRGRSVITGPSHYRKPKPIPE